MHEPPHTEPEVDLELLAALLDGRLRGAERARALRLLRESDAAREVFADAIRVTNDPSVHTVLPLVSAPRHRRVRRWAVVVPLAAAAVLTIAVLPTMRSQSETALLLATNELVAPVTDHPDAAARLGTGWEQHTWSVLRGGPSPQADSALSFRLGVRTVDLRVALELGDLALADRLAGEMLGWLESVDFVETASSDYRAFRSRLRDSSDATVLLGEATRLEAKLGELLHPFWFGFGQWCGAGELASQVGSGTFLESSLTTQVLNEALQSGRFADQDARALRELDALRSDTSATRDARMRDLFQALVGRHGG
ncbi:MAG TPA: hypothetical protein VF178_04605 [Gemmatimonadaceae bacterium]